MTSRTHAFAPPPRRSRGFTLIEALVVLVLLSILMLAMVSALRSVGQGSERAETRFQRLDDWRVATRFLHDTLGRVSMRSVTTARGSGPLFEGASDHIAWVGVMPARYGAGGRYFFRLSIENLQGQPGLALRYLPWADQPTVPAWENAAVQPLLPGVQGLALHYLDPRQSLGAPAWVDAWEPLQDRPSAVALELSGTGLLLDRQVLALRPLPIFGAEASDGVVAGGSR